MMPEQPTSYPTYVQVRVDDWRDAVAMAANTYGWLFRGQRCATWGLQTALERIAIKYRCPEGTWHEQEEEILSQFKRQSHQFIQHLPAHNDQLEWLSLIQHHGGPTRLLDFTRSFYVAAFFAMEDADGDAAVWAVNQSRLDSDLMHAAEAPEYGDHQPSVRELAMRCASDCIRPSQPTVDRLLAEDWAEEHPEQTRPNPVTDRPNVLAVKPWRLNQRMIIQQGWFLLPTSLDAYFEHNLCGAFGMSDVHLPTTPRSLTLNELREAVTRSPFAIGIAKLILPRELHLEAMRDLERMNITAATLFPGLDGFARSLQSHLRVFRDLAEVEQ